MMMANTSLRITPLGSVAKVISGFAFKSAEFCGSGIPVVKIKNIRLGEVDLAEIQYVPEQYSSIDSKYHIHRGDILISLTGSHINQPNSVVGRVARYKKLSTRALLNQRAGKLLIKNPEECDSGFLFYQLFSEKMRQEIAAFAYGAANQANVSPGQIESLYIHLPHITMQRKIASILSAYDDLIENNQRRIKILEEMAQNLYREWFVKFSFPIYRSDGTIERFHNPETDPMQDSPRGLIPLGWKHVVLGNLCRENRTGVNPDKFSKETPYIGLEHMPRRSITLSDWGCLDDVISTKLLYKKGDIIFGKIRPYFHKVGVALTDGLCSSDAIVINPLNKIHFGQVLCCVSSDDFIAQATKTSQGTKMPRANWNVMTQYPCPLPNDHLSAAFSEQISLLVNQCCSLAPILFT